MSKKQTILMCACGVLLGVGITSILPDGGNTVEVIDLELRAGVCQMVEELPGVSIYTEHKSDDALVIAAGRPLQRVSPYYEGARFWFTYQGEQWSGAIYDIRADSLRVSLFKGAQATGVIK